MFILNSVVGIDNPKTMKLAGHIGEERVVVMVDQGATHNFLSPKVVEKLGSKMASTEEFGVTFGTGKTCKGWGVCKEVELDLGALTIVEQFLPLELGHSNIILDIKWLAKLGTIAMNWKVLMMQFHWKG